MAPPTMASMRPAETLGASAPGAWRARLRSWMPLFALDVAAGMTAYCLKAFYSGANADQLRWVLGPTCWLAGRLGGMTFTDEAGAGFISHAQHLVVGPACSGLNFLIACFAALFFSFAHRWRRIVARAAWLPGSLAVAWLATIATNALRVSLAASLYQADIYGDLLTPERAHRLLGTLLYCGALVALHGLVRRQFEGRAAKAGAAQGWRAWLSLGAPFACYLGLVIIVPLARLRPGALDARMMEHTATVAATALALAGLGVIANRLGDRLQSKTGATSRK